MIRTSTGSVWTGFIRSLFTLGAVCLGIIVIGTLWDVFARSVPQIHAPVWLGTVIEFGLPSSAMLAAPWLVRIRGHVAMELIDAALNTRQRKALQMLTDTAAAGICLFVAWYAGLAGLDSFERGEVAVRAVDVPRWYLYAILATGLTLCALEFLRHVALAYRNKPTKEPKT
ncbi:TRAP transporter small permease [Celeribacter sp.]|uniref:TRAP transporter small permease n=1 Tax=Celeribacter sp. TaxID=1890673 RepID=UPI003A943DA7